MDRRVPKHALSQILATEPVKEFESPDRRDSHDDHVDGPGRGCVAAQRLTDNSIQFASGTKPLDA